jgi:hypothetical protein
MSTVATALRRPSLGLGILLAALVCGCGAGTETPSPTPTAASPATPTPTATLTAAVPADPCAWLLRSDAPSLLGHAVDTSWDATNTDPGVANGLLECGYSTGSLEERTPPPPAIETDTLVTILNSSAFAQAQEPTQPDAVSYTIHPVPASSIIPGALSSVVTFFAVHVARVVGGNGTWTSTYLYVRTDGNIYFRVGVVDPSGSTAQRQAKDVTAAHDVLRNLRLVS